MDYEVNMDQVTTTKQPRNFQFKSARHTTLKEIDEDEIINTMLRRMEIEKGHYRPPGANMLTVIKN